MSNTPIGGVSHVNEPNGYWNDPAIYSACVFWKEFRDLCMGLSPNAVPSSNR